MTTNQPPPYPGDDSSSTNDPPAYGSVPPASGDYPPGGYQQPPAPGGYYPPPETNKKALWSMILGIVGLICCGIFAGVPAIILANISKKEIATSGGRQTGEGMATAGLVTGFISVALTVVSVVLYSTGVLELPDL